MSYPEPVYLGEPGLVNAAFRPATHDPEVRYRAGGTAHYLATGASTDGHFGLYRWEMPDTRGGPPPHFHRSISESFFVLSGTVGLYDGTAWRTPALATSCTSRRAASTRSGTRTDLPRC